LQPERALTTGFGGVYRPNWLPGFNVSFDYFNIDLKGAIASVGAGALLDLCFAGSQVACASITTIGTDPNGLPRLQIRSGPQNFASERQKGFDIESSYQLPLSSIQDSWDGGLTFRFLATHAISYRSESGLPGSIARELAGQNSGPAKWRYQANVSLDLDPMTLGLTMRGISSGTMDNSWVTCTTGCPVSTATALTTDWNYMAGAKYFDFNAKYVFRPNDESEIELFFAVRNLMNKDPAIFYPGPGNNSWQRIPTTVQKYDPLGRVYRAGLRFTM
jgi:iron complex outermembrane receptor protein